MSNRLLFLDAKRTIRSHMAASILTFKDGYQWDIWSTPIQDTQESAFALRVLEEVGIPLIDSPHITEPSFGLHWDEAIILCSGLEDT